MRNSLTSKCKVLLTTCFAIVASVCIAIACCFILNFTTVKAAGNKIGDHVYQTDGSSVRVFEKDVEGALVETQRTGIRFHVEMGEGYSYGGQTVVDTSATNERNGSFKLRDGFKTYTLIIPTRLLTEELSLSTDKIMKLDTSEYWYYDGDENLESVAYVWNVPKHRLTDNFSFRGVICTVDENGVETLIAQTAVAERCIADVSKKALKATNAGTQKWDGKEARAIEILEDFIPKYNITYKVNGVETYETVLWGDAPQNVPTNNVKGAWYDTESHDEVDVSLALNFDTDKTFVLETTAKTEFIFTGVADINNVTFNGEIYNGAKIYATLPQGKFPYDKELDIHAVNYEYEGNGEFSGIEKVFVLKEDNQDRIVFVFDSSKMHSGDKIIIKGDSIFYVDGEMFMLTEDYTIDYTIADGVEDYGIFLGYIYSSDIKEIRNYTEDRDKDPSNGEEFKTIRITFYSDLFINSNFTFVNDDLPEGYEFPVYIKCPQYHVNNKIEGGYYYWNDGEHKILELSGYGNHAQDELFGAAGTKLVQNGGYYIFKDAMYAYYRGNGDGINQNDDEVWVIGNEIGKFNNSSFEIVGENANDTVEVRFTTKTNVIDSVEHSGRWWSDGIQLTIENMSHTEPYAAFFTSANGAITPLTDFRYHGQDYTDNEGILHHHQILGFSGVRGTTAGEKITIIAGSRLWSASEYWTTTEDIIAYYNGTNWVVGTDGTANSYITTLDCSNKNFNLFEVGINKVRITFTNEEFNGAFGGLTLETGSVKINGIRYNNLHYHGGGNRIFEIIGDSTKALGTNEFEDYLTIEKGTRLWLNSYCIEFSEEIILVFVGNRLTDGSGNVFNYHWVPANNNTNISNANITRVYDFYDENDPVGKLRFKLSVGIFTNAFIGHLAINPAKGIPVVNGVEKLDKAFCHGKVVENSDNIYDLIELRGGETGDTGGSGSYAIIPKGSVWYSTQGSFTFTETIVCVYDGSEWFAGFNPDSQIETITNDDVEYVFIQDNGGGNAELRMQLSKELLGHSYYQAVALLGDVHLSKTNGSSVKTSYGYWYGGNSAAYSGHDHSLLGFRSTGLSKTSDFSEGDVITLTEGTKIIFTAQGGMTGYHVIGEDISYIYSGGSWLNANLRSVTFNLNKSSVTANGIVVGSNGLVDGIQKGRSISFTVEPNYGYHLVSVKIGNTTLNAVDGVYTYTVNEDVTVDVNTAPNEHKASVTIENASISGIAHGDSIYYDQTYPFTVSANSGYAITSVKINDAEQGTNGSYSFTTTGDTSIVIETKKTYAVTWTNPTGATISVSANGAQISSGTRVIVGTNITVNVTPSISHNVNSITVNENTISNGSTHTVNEDTVVSAITQIKTYTVSATTKGGVSVDETSKTIEYGEKATFTLTVPNNATIKANGTVINGNTYTVNNVTGDVKVDFTTWYKATVNAGNTTISGVTNGTLYETGTALNLTVTAKNSYLLTDVTINGASVGIGGTYSLTVTENVTIATTTVYLTDISDTISIENWNGISDGEDYTWFVIKSTTEDKYMIPVAEMQPTGNAGSIYWNDHLENTAFNYGLDPMEYILIDGVSLRTLINQNAIDNKYVGTTFPFSSGTVYAPVTLEMGGAGSAGLWLKVMKDLATEFEITVKQGFIFAGENGINYYMSKDASIFYAGSIGQKVNDLWIGTTKATVSGVTDGQKITFGESYNFTVTPATGYNISSVTINDVEYGTSGSYTYVATNQPATIIVTTTPKAYKATVSASNAMVSGISNNQDIYHDQTYNFTVSANSGYVVTSVKINGTEQGTGGSYSFTASGATSIVVTTAKTYTVTASCSGGVSVTNTPQTVVSGGSVTFNLNVPSNATIKANGTQINGTTYTVNNVTADTTVTFTTWYTVKVTSLTEGSVKVNGTNRSVNWSALIESGKTITVQATYNQEDDRKCTVGSESWSDTNSHTVTISGKTDITVYSKKSCLVEGSMVLMADGTQKAVENIVTGDKVMVFNHETGKYEVGTVWFNDHADSPAVFRHVINLEFANGSKSRIAYEHGYFDLDLMRYVFIREDNMHEFIGHRFVTSTFNGTEVVQGETTLVKAYITEEVVKVYGPITEYHFNMVTDDMLSMPSFNFDATGMVNIFEYDEDLKYNAEKMQADIETYGVFTYEEFSAYMSYEDYCKAPIAYFKVAIGKGNLTWEQIELTLNYLAENEF